MHGRNAYKVELDPAHGRPRAGRNGRSRRERRLGRRIRRVDGPAKVTGAARYAAEFHRDGLAYAATADSTIAAGRITGIDVAAAERAPGVLLVLTHLNADRLPYRTPPERPAVDPVSGDQLRVLRRPTSGSAASPSAWSSHGPRRRRSTAPPRAHHLRARPGARTRSTRRSPGPPRKRPRRRGAARRPGRATRRRRSPRRPCVWRPATCRRREQHNAMEPHATVAPWEGDRADAVEQEPVGGQRARRDRPSLRHPARHVRVVNPFVGGAFGSALRTWPHVTLAAHGRAPDRTPGSPGADAAADVHLRGLPRPHGAARRAGRRARRSAHRHDARGRGPDLHLRGVRGAGAGRSSATYACPNR